MNKDEDDVNKAMDTIESWMNPFKSRDQNKPLSNIASGVKATYNIVDHFLTVEQKSNGAFTTFVQIEKRQQTSDVDLFAPLPKAKLQTFQKSKSKKTNVAESDIVIKADRGLLARIVIIAQNDEWWMMNICNMFWSTHHLDLCHGQSRLQMLLLRRQQKRPCFTSLRERLKLLRLCHPPPCGSWMKWLCYKHWKPLPGTFS